MFSLFSCLHTINFFLPGDTKFQGQPSVFVTMCFFLLSYLEHSLCFDHSFFVAMNRAIKHRENGHCFQSCICLFLLLESFRVMLMANGLILQYSLFFIVRCLYKKKVVSCQFHP